MFGREKTISPRRARRIYEMQRLATLIADLDRENARREQERNRPCPLCAAARTDTEESHVYTARMLGVILTREDIPR